ncbi:MAG: transposase [Gammaproteobacteria bacterium]|nr:transposase [Gammaproteobacteria bacterium]
MTRARRELVSLDATPYYHCISRCVRRAFLCGKDHASGRDFSHRRAWIVARIKQLAAVFAIDVAAYAVMNNHSHVVLRVDAERAQAWSREEVIERWRTLFAGPLLVQRLVAGESLLDAELAAIDKLVDTWRGRLADISWFMRCLNEHVARLANAEDGCTGRFWEGRFRCRALLDDTAVLSCMAYVDLNPIRAGMANTPESSDFTSIQERLGIVGAGDPDWDADSSGPPPSGQADLLPFAGALGRSKPDATIPFALTDYAELIEWTGRALQDGKRGHIAENTPALLQRLAIPTDARLKATHALETRFPTAIGAEERIAALCRNLKRRWLRGARACRELYRPAILPT